jgi:ribosomal protein L11 methyltransferase
MNYISIHIPIDNEEVRSIIIALLADAGYEGFEENDEELIATIPQANYNQVLLCELLLPFQLPFKQEVITPQNWNKVWEDNFKPIILPGFCTIKAHFHEIVVETPYCIRITPKMSFGTGHHATTQLMLQGMRQLNFEQKDVFDYGTGTGILAIMAEMMHAKHVKAVDNDIWCYENALENVAQNECTHIEVAQGTINLVANCNFDIILANINRHILLESMHALYTILNAGGQLLMSGLLTEDEAIITESALKCGFKRQEVSRLENWIAIRFTK